MAAETVVDYAVTTYGREWLPALVQGLGQYETWDELVPAVFDIPVSEFEAGWQAYLTTRYQPTSEAQLEPKTVQE
jgi:hypothetical protein